jgi:hypothetical protein
MKGFHWPNQRQLNIKKKKKETSAKWQSKISLSVKAMKKWQDLTESTFFTTLEINQKLTVIAGAFSLKKKKTSQKSKLYGFLIYPSYSRFPS